MPPETLYTLVHTALRRERIALRILTISCPLFIILPFALGNILGAAAFVLLALAALASACWLAYEGSRLARLYKKHNNLRALDDLPIRAGEHFGFLRIIAADDEELRARHILHPTALIILRPIAMLTGIALAALAVFLVARGHLPVTNAWWLVIGLAGVALAGFALVPATLAWSITQTPESLNLTVLHQRWNGRRITYSLSAERIDAVHFDDECCTVICDQRTDTDYSGLRLASVQDGKRPWRAQRLAADLARRLAVPPIRTSER